jgi:hypothetical protein
MSATLKQRIAQSIDIKQHIHSRECSANVLESLKDKFEQAAEKLFKSKHRLEHYAVSIVAATNRRQMVLRVDGENIILEKQLFLIGGGCKSFRTQGLEEVTAKLDAIINKEINND